MSTCPQVPSAPPAAAPSPDPSPAASPDEIRAGVDAIRRKLREEYAAGLDAPWDDGLELGEAW